MRHCSSENRKARVMVKGSRKSQYRTYPWLLVLIGHLRVGWQSRKMKLVRFLIYNFQMDGVCGLSPTLVLIRKGFLTPLVWWRSLSLSISASGIDMSLVLPYLCSGDLYGVSTSFVESLLSHIVIFCQIKHASSYR